jgi:hypothetical protein
MRQLTFTAFQTLLDLSQAVRPSELAEHHRDELLPAAHPARVPLRVELANLAFKVTARKKLENLTEQAAKCVHVEPFSGAPNRLAVAPAYTGRLNVPSANLDGSENQTQCLSKQTVEIQPWYAIN